MKIIKWIILAVVVIVVIIGLAVYFNLNSIVRSEVQSQTQASLNLPTKLQSASLSLFGGTVSLTNLEIGSPEGFSAPQMFGVGGVKVGVSYGQLRHQPIHIGEIRINHPAVTIEQSNGKFNFQTLMDRPQAPPPSGEPIKLIIDTLEITDAVVTLRPGLPGIAPEIPVPIPSVTMNNIGNDNNAQNGVAIKEVVTQVMAALAKSAANSDKVPAELRGLLTLNADEVKARLTTEVTNQLNKVTGDLNKDVGKSIDKNVGDVLGGLTGDKKKKK
jgi:uncharacterized protein involved in outer membrane biogenesis